MCSPSIDVRALSDSELCSRIDAFESKETGGDLRALAELIERGDVTPIVGRTFPLIEAADAVRLIETGHAAGKVVVTV